MTQPPAPEESRDPTDGIPWNQLTPRQLLQRKIHLARAVIARGREQGHTEMVKAQEKSLARHLADLERLDAAERGREPGRDPEHRPPCPRSR